MEEELTVRDIGPCIINIEFVVALEHEHTGPTSGFEDSREVRAWVRIQLIVRGATSRIRLIELILRNKWLLRRALRISLQVIHG